MDDSRTVSFGLKGSADILGILAPAGRFLAIEVKTGTGKQTPQQVRFEHMIRVMGGVYILARSVSCVAKALESYMVV